MNRHQKHVGIIISLTLFILLILSSCKSSSVETPVPIPTPLPNEGIITGIVNNLNGEPISDTPVRLAQVYRQDEQGAFVLDLSHSPSSISSADGKFVILSIPPAEYLLVVGKPEDNNYIIYQGNDGKPISFIVEGGKIMDAGQIKVDFKP
jgi:hypothetical protein